MSDPIGYGYVVTTWADGFGVWHAKAEFRGAGAGNSPEGLRLIANAHKNLRKAIRREIVEREAPRKIRPLRYHVVANQEASTGQLMSLTIAEKSN